MCVCMGRPSGKRVSFLWIQGMAALCGTVAEVFCPERRAEMAGEKSAPKIVGLTPDRRQSFYGRDIVSVKQFSRDDLTYIFGVADEMRSTSNEWAPRIF